ncbi:MAG: TylF/MycF/NovP-related O-methyltransferase [Patescibacteria group bacterium]
MKFIKMAIQKFLASHGFELASLSQQRVDFKNFENLARAYEQNLNEKSSVIIPENSTRYKLLARLLGTPPSEAYFIVQGLCESKNVPGEVCEFGVAQGETSALIANEILSGNKKLHLFDSFEGLPRPSEKDILKDDILSLGSMEAYTGTMSCPEDMVLARLKAILFPSERLITHKGFIEKLDLEDDSLPKEVSFAYVDFDFYEPIKIALDYLDKVTPKSAVVVVDDYDFFSTGSKTAVDEFIKKMNSKGERYKLFIPDSKYGYFAILTKISS